MAVSLVRTLAARPLVGARAVAPLAPVVGRARVLVVAPRALAAANPAAAKEAEARGAVRVFSTDKRPLSPHLTIWKFELNAITSVVFRGTGMALMGGCAATSIAMLFASHPIGYYIDGMRGMTGLMPLVKFGVAFPLAYHYIGGLRHLGFDNLVAQDIDSAFNTAKVLVGASAVVGLGAAFVEF